MLELGPGSSVPAAPAPTPAQPSAASGSTNPTEERLVKLIDQRLQELGEKIERSLEHAPKATAAIVSGGTGGAAAASGATGSSALVLAPQHQALRSVAPLPDNTPSPLLLLAMSKADAAERVVSELRSDLTAVERNYQRTAEELERRVAGLGDASRQHVDRSGHLQQQVEALSTYQSGERLFFEGWFWPSTLLCSHTLM